MSETEQEPQEPVTEPEPEPTQPEPEPEQDDENAEEDAAEAAAQAETPESDKEIEAVYVKLETRAKNYVKSVGEILSGHEVPVVLCELCSDAYPGMRWVQPADEVHAAMIAVSGSAGAESPLRPDPDALECERCGGFGWNSLPSHVPNNEARMCRACNGAGFVELSPQSGALQAPVRAPENGSSPELPGVPLDDPAVVDLRARGYMVMPMPHLDLPGGEQA